VPKCVDDLAAPMRETGVHHERALAPLRELLDEDLERVRRALAAELLALARGLRQPAS
jgi:hypothetical protein